MTTVGSFSSSGLYIALFTPRIAVTAGTPDTATYTARGAALGQPLRGEITAYTHSIAAFGGFDSAQWSIAVTSDEAEEWLARGVGAHVEVGDAGGQRCWEGRVDSVEVQIGGAVIRRGPLRDVYNQVKVIYSTIDTSTSPPTLGVRVETAWAEDVDSEARWGVRRGIFSTQGMSDAQATQYRDMALLELAEPWTTRDLTLARTAGKVNVTFQAYGYYQYCWYPYNSTTTGTQNLSVKLAAVVDAEPNALIRSTNGTIATNTFQVGTYDNDNRNALDIIRELVALGDASFNRYLFGVWEDRQTRYVAAPTTVEYLMAAKSSEQAIRLASGQRLEHWQVRPGKWLRFTDMLSGYPAAAPKDDPASMFVERVQFTWPAQLQLQGGYTDSLQVLMAQYGLSGGGGF